MSEQTFSAGDLVEWESQAAGSKTTKRGAIVQIVPAGRRRAMSPETMRACSRSRISDGSSRNHESYIVNVDGTAYWPRVKHLRKVGVVACPECERLRALLEHATKFDYKFRGGWVMAYDADDFWRVVWTERVGVEEASNHPTQAEAIARALEIVAEHEAQQS